MQEAERPIRFGRDTGTQIGEGGGEVRVQRKSQWELAELDYMAGMKYREIAEKYGVSLSTVKSWKTRHGWNRKGGRKAVARKKTGRKKEYAYGGRTNACIQTEEEQKAREEEKRRAMMTLVKVDEINERQRLFALFYFQTHNATSSYQRAYGCTRTAAAASAHKLLKNPVIQMAIREMQADRDATLLLTAGDVVDLYMRIAFADYSDFVSIADGVVTIKNIAEADAQLISEVKETKFGVEIKLADRMKALRWLADYFELNPSDRHRAAYQSKMAELREREIKSKEEGW